MEEGWVYVLVNSSMPGMAKVGRTTRPPRDRAAELSGVTGVASPFIVAYQQAFADCHAAERAIHAELDRQGLRVRPNREFFYAAPSDIIRLVLQAGDAATCPDIASSHAVSHSAQALMLAGERALHGLEDALQDTGEAVRCFKLAAARGAPEAFERLGTIYTRLYADRRDRAGRRRAMAPLKEGVRRGNPYCYGVMAELFALDGHAANTAKAWSLFYAAVPPADAGPDNPRFVEACCRYIAQCLDRGVAPDHLACLRPVGDAVLASMLAELGASRTDPVARRRLAACLRWAYAHVLSEPAFAPPQPPARAVRRFWRVRAGVAAA